MSCVTAQNRVSAITGIYAHASTFPCRVRTEAGGEWVMKLQGSGPGPVAMLTELLALRVARAMGLAVPDARPLHLPPGFPWTIGTDEFDGIVQRSFGWNLGVAYVADAAPATIEQIFAADPHFWETLAAVDRLLGNMDRTARNPNILAAPHGLVAIDFDACLFARRAAQGVVPKAFPLPAGHLLEGHAAAAPHRPLDPATMTDALREVPADWLEMLDIYAEDLRRNLTDYVGAWNDG